MSHTTPIPLQSFLQLLMSRKVPIARAMNIAGKVYKQANTPEELGRLTSASLLGFGVTEKDDRDAVLGAVDKAGYRALAVAKSKDHEAQKRKAAETETGSRKSTRKRRPEAADTEVTPKEEETKPVNVVSSLKPLPRKRRKLDDTQLRDELLPDKPWDEGDALGSLNFEETLDEKVLAGQYAIVNRAPIMMAWSYIVAEQMGFVRQEALSIASVYTEMNALTKGLSLGIYDKKAATVMEASPHGTQPYVDLMGRRIPLYKTSEDSWRALNKDGKPAPPATAYSYILRSLKQATPAIIGALRLLAQSFSPEQINRVGWSLYADFRPQADGWGKRGRVDCDAILKLRPRIQAEQGSPTARSSLEDVVKYEANYVDLPTCVPDVQGEAGGLSDIDDLFDGDFTAEELDALP